MHKSRRVLLVKPWVKPSGQRILGSLLVLSCLMLGTASTASAQPVMGVDLSNATPAEISALGRAGATVVRFEISYQGENPNWTGLDETVATAADSGIRVQPVLYKFTKGTEYPEAGEFVQWNEWVGKVVGRYGVGGTFWQGRSKVIPATAWEVWNEPNLPQNSPGGQINPSSYGKLLANTALVIRSKSGLGTKVLFGGLYSPAGGIASYIQTATTAAGGPAAYDGLSLHPYGWGNTTSEKIQALKNWVNEARQGLENAGAGAKPLSITEIGWPLAAGAANQQVNEVTQADLLTESFNYLKSRADVEAILWYDSRDSGRAQNWDDFCGLREAGGYARPSWFRFEQQTGAPEWSPVGWYDDHLTGELTSNPDLASWGAGRLDMVIRGTDNALWHRWYEGGSGWSGWERIGGSLTSGPSIASWGAGRIDIVARTWNGSVQHWWWQGGGWGSDNLGGTIANGSDPDISSGQSGRLDVYIKGTDNALWHKWFYPTVGWSGWERIGGNLASGPGAVSWAPGRYDIVARLSDNTVQHWWWAGGWHSDNLGGAIASGPDLASPEPGRLDVFAASVNPVDGIWKRTFQEGAGWAGWEHIGAEIAGGPGAVAWGADRLDVVGKDPNGGIAHYWWQP